MRVWTWLPKSWKRTLLPRITEFTRRVTGISNQIFVQNNTRKRPRDRCGRPAAAPCGATQLGGRRAARTPRAETAPCHSAQPRGTERTERRSSEPSIASARNEPSPTPRRLKTLLGAEKLSNPVRGRENALSRAEPAPLTRTAPARSVSRRGRGSLGLPPPPLFAPSGGSAISNGGTDRRRPTR